jgi:type II secretion system (T2SS) protein M
MNPLLKRALVENRAWIFPLLLALLANVFAYLIVVRPLAVKSAGAADRALEAASALRAAEKVHLAAQGLVSGKMQADEELKAFYQKVLPSDLAGARRITYASLPALVRKARVKYEGRTTNVEAVDKEKLLGKMSIRMVLHGNYEGLRQFIYDLERSPEFVIIDDLSMVEGKGNEALTLTINLSTYYRLRSDGV